MKFQQLRPAFFIYGAFRSDLSSKDEEIEKIRAQLQLAENAQRRCRDSEECLYLENEQLRNDLIALTLELSKQRSQQNKDQAEMFRQLAVRCWFQMPEID